MYAASRFTAPTAPYCPLGRLSLSVAFARLFSRHCSSTVQIRPTDVARYGEQQSAVKELALVRKAGDPGLAACSLLRPPRGRTPNA